MGKSSGTNSTVTQTSAPNPQFQQAYQGAVSNAQNLAAQPYQQYPGGTSSLLAPLQPYQNAAIGEIANAQGMSQPLLNTAATDFNKAATPVTATPFSTAAVNQYLSPYTQDVTSSLQNLFNQQNATQQSQVTGNAAAEGAFGGDRSAVAAALTAGQQQAQEAPVLAQNLQTGYNTALGEFNAQQQANLQAQQATGWLEQGAGYGQANLGQEAQNLYLSGANALLGAGGLEQQQAQEGLNIPYEQFIAQESYPYQMAGWEANIAEGLGGASGGTSSTQYPGPSALSQAAGLGLTGTGLLGATGAFGSGGYLTGSNGLLSGLFSGGADAAGADAASLSALGDLGGIGSATDFIGGDAALGLLGARHGGRIPRQGGGALTSPYNTGLQLPGMANQTTGAPQLPNLATGYLPTPPPSPGASRTMPTVAGMGQQQQQQPVQQALQTLAALKGIKGLFPGDSADMPSAAMGGAVTLATPYHGFDDGGAPVLQAGQAATGGASPLSQGMIQQYMQLPMEQLQELAQRSPPQTPHGQAIQRALQMKKMNPGSAIGGAGAPTPPMSPQGMGVTPAPVGPATSALSPTLATAWKGGRIKRDAGGDIPGIDIAPNSPLAAGTGEPSLASPDLSVPGVSLATGPGANVVTQKGDQPPQSVPLPPKTAPASASGAGLATPSPAAAPSLANPPSSSILPPVLQSKAQRESGGNYTAQNPTTSASGVLQDVDATWREAEHGLGYGDQWAHAKDAPPEVQNAANIWLHGRYGDKPWAASEPGHGGNKQQPSLATGPSRDNTGAGGSALMAPMTDAGSTNTNDQNIQAALALLGRNQQTPQGSFYNSPWMPLVAAGAGMLASRSPFPGVALGEGLETGLKELGSQQAAVPENQLRQAQAQVANVNAALIGPKMQALGAAGAAGAGMPPSAAESATPPIAGQVGGVGTGVPAGAEGAPASIATAAAQPAIQGPGGMPLPTNFGKNPQFAAYDNTYQEIGNQIAQLQHFMQVDPEHGAQNIENLAKLRESYVNTMLHDPRMEAQTEAMKDWAAVAPKAAEAGAAKAAEMPSTIQRGRPGDIMFQGTNPVAAVPEAREIEDPQSGRKYWTWVTPPINAAQATQQTQATQTATPGAPAGTVGVAAIGPGEHESLEARAKDEQANREGTIKDAQAAQYQQATLERLKADAANWTPGPLAAHRYEAERYLRLINPSFDQPVESYEDFIKNAGALTRQATREVSPRAAFQEMQFIGNTLPNLEMSPKGLNGVISEYQGLNDYRQAKMKAQDQWEQQHGGVGHVEGFENDWNAKAYVTPYTFIISRMPQDERQQLFGTWAKTDEGRAQLQRLAQERQYAVSNGLAQ